MQPHLVPEAIILVYVKRHLVASSLGHDEFVVNYFKQPFVAVRDDG